MKKEYVYAVQGALAAAGAFLSDRLGILFFSVIARNVFAHESVTIESFTSCIPGQSVRGYCIRLWEKAQCPETRGLIFSSKIYCS